MKLPDARGKSAGNIDIVLVSYDERGRILDFGALEVQAVYISGNIRQLFEHYLASPEAPYDLVELVGVARPRADYLSSSRKRLAPQLLFKGGILNAWRKKQAVALQRPFFDSLPPLPRANPEDAEIAWLIYDLVRDHGTDRLKLTRADTVYTRFQPALMTITTPDVGPVDSFVAQLQGKLDEKLDGGHPPDAPTLTDESEC